MRPARLLAAALLALTTAALLPATAAVADGEGVPPGDRNTGAWCENRPVGFAPFTDIGRSPIVREQVECLNRAAIVSGGPEGLSGDRYGPSLVVRRGAMASFIARALDVADRLDAGDLVQALPPAPARFSDVPAGDLHSGSIARLAAAGIVQGGVGGRPADTYSPELVVTRAQMASFVNRAMAFAMGQDPAQAGRGAGYSTAVDYYVDDAATGIHQASINGITSQGVALGDGKDLYGPAEPIIRVQMAAFLTRALASLHHPTEPGMVKRVRRMDAPGGARAVVQPDDSRRHVVRGSTHEVDVTSALPIASVAVTGPVTVQGVLADRAPDSPTYAVSFTVRPDAPVGDRQYLTWTTTFADGSTDVDTMRIVPTLPVP